MSKPSSNEEPQSTPQGHDKDGSSSQLTQPAAEGGSHGEDPDKHPKGQPEGEDTQELEKLSELLVKGELSEEERRQVQQLLQRHSSEVAVAINTTISEFRGPLPPPAILRGYEEIVPGAAGKIVEWADSERQHRHQMEGLMVRATTKRDLRGQIFAAIVAMGGFGLAAYALNLGHPFVATLITALDLGGIVTAFIYGRRSQAAEDEG